MQRSIKAAVQEVLRETGGQARPVEAVQAIADALAIVDGKANWEFLLTSAILHLKGPYSTGTASVNYGSQTVSISGAADLTGLGFQTPRCEVIIDSHRPYRVQTITQNSLTLTRSFGQDGNFPTRSLVGKS